MQVQIAGEWLEVSYNPGDSAKKEYAPEIFRHKDYKVNRGDPGRGDATDQEHWMPCPDPGRHDCLQHLPGDGNLDLWDMWP